MKKENLIQNQLFVIERIIKPIINNPDEPLILSTKCCWKQIKDIINLLKTNGHSQSVIFEFITEFISTEDFNDFLKLAPIKLKQFGLD